MSKPEFPEPTRINGRLFWDRFELENFKRSILGLQLLARDPTDPIVLVNAGRVSQEFDFGRRTLGRRVDAYGTALGSGKAA